MKNGYWVWMGVLIILLGACSPAPAQTIEVEVTRLSPIEVTREVTKIVEIIITATPLPATTTPSPSSTPEFTRWTGQQVIDAFQASGLEVGDYREMVKDDYGKAPMMASEGIRFLIPSLCSDCGGRVMAFDTPSGLDATKVYYDSLSQTPAFFFVGFCQR